MFKSDFFYFWSLKFVSVFVVIWSVAIILTYTSHYSVQIILFSCWRSSTSLCQERQERLSVEQILIYCAEYIDINFERTVWYSSSCVNYFIHMQSWPLIFNLMAQFRHHNFFIFNLIVIIYLVIHIFSSHCHIHVFNWCIILVLKSTSHQNPLADYDQYNVLEELLQGQEEMEFEIDSEFSSQGIIKHSTRKWSIGIVDVLKKI